MNIDFRITGIRSCECLAAAHPGTPDQPTANLAGLQILGLYLVELIGIEPTTPWLQTRCSPS